MSKKRKKVSKKEKKGRRKETEIKPETQREENAGYRGRQGEGREEDRRPMCETLVVENVHR